MSGPSLSRDAREVIRAARRAESLPSEVRRRAFAAAATTLGVGTAATALAAGAQAAVAATTVGSATATTVGSATATASATASATAASGTLGAASATAASGTLGAASAAGAAGGTAGAAGAALGTATATAAASGSAAAGTAFGVSAGVAAKVGLGALAAKVAVVGFVAATAIAIPVTLDTSTTKQGPERDVASSVRIVPLQSARQATDQRRPANAPLPAESPVVAAPVVAASVVAAPVPAAPVAAGSVLAAPVVSATRALSAAPPRIAPSPAPDPVLLEAGLLREALVAARVGDNARALEFVREHAARFPAGRLSAERETIRARALATANRADSEEATIP